MSRCIGIVILALWTVASPPAAAQSAEARAAIQAATNRALAALRASDRAGYRAVLHPDFRAIDAKNKVQAGPGFVTPQRHNTDAGGMAMMRLDEAASTLRTIRMPGPREAVVTGEETLVWTGRHGPDIVSATPDGRRAITPNTERRTVVVTYRRHWVKTAKGWLLKRSRTLSERATAVL